VTRLQPPDGYTIERLDAELHERERFLCGNNDLDEYLRTQANQKQSRMLAGTHVLLETAAHAEGKRPVVGFLTLATVSIPLAECPEAFRKITNRHELTVMLLARMAVDSNHKGKGLGKFLVQYAFDSAVRQAEISGCPAIIVDAKDEALTFYPKYGFVSLPDDPKRMFIPTTKAKIMLSTLEDV
jgi:GNAT superfamily N-acetyltransferase